MKNWRKRILVGLIPLIVVTYFVIALFFAGRLTPLPGGTAYGVITFLPVPECQHMAEDLVRVFPQRPLPDMEYQYIEHKLKACSAKHKNDAKKVDG